MFGKNRHEYIKKLMIFILAAALILNGSALSALGDEILSENSAVSISADTVSGDGSLTDTVPKAGTVTQNETGSAETQKTPNTALTDNEISSEPENGAQEKEEQGKSQLTGETPEEASENTASENTASENSASQNSASENSSSEAAVSDNEALLEAEAVSGNEAPDIEAYILSANEALRNLTQNKIIPAVIVMCDEYGLKSEPRGSASTIANLPVSTTVYPKEVAYADGVFWFKADTYVNEAEYTGYINKENLIYVDADMLEWERTYLDAISEALKGGSEGLLMAASSAGSADDEIKYAAQAAISTFPASYQSALNSLSAKHSNWVFVPQNVGVSFAAALAGELSDKNKNWIYHTAPASYKNGAAATNWYYASQSCLEYYMDPRNFLSEKYIFQFETLGYNPSYQTASGVQSFLNKTFMKGTIPGDSLTYAEAFAKTGAAHKVSPYHLAARVYQEQGVNGTSAIISGTYSGYEGYYNYFNIKASGTDPILNGLIYAKQQGWNTRYKALDGGAEFLGSTYIGRGQDTLYTQKYNVASSSSRYSHQYMQNAQAAATESAAIYSIYNSSGSLNDAFIFKIPVYTDMTVPSNTDSDETIAEALKVKPAVTLKSVRPVNIFGTSLSDMGIYRISTTGKILSVSSDAASLSAQSSAPAIVLDHTSGNLVYLKAVNAKNSAVSGINRSVKLTITLDGFEGSDYSFNAAIKSEKPKIKLKKAVIYSGLGSGEALITDSAGNIISLPEDTAVKTTAADVKVSMNSDRSGVIITPLNASSFKAGSRKLTFSSSEWNSDLTLSVSVKKASKPTLALSAKTVVFNKSVTASKKVIRYSVNGSGLSVNRLEIEGANVKSANALDAGYISAVKTSEGRLTLGFASGAAAGTYTYKLTGTIDDFGGTSYTMKSVKLSIKVVNKTPDKVVGISAKGNVNLVNRGGTDRLYTLSRLNQIGAESITAVSVEGENSSKFSAEVLLKGSTDDNGYTVKSEAGAIAVHAQSGAALSHKISYAIPLKITLDNGYVLTKTVKLKPTNKRAKLSTLVKTITLTRGSTDKACYLVSSGIGNDNTLISSAELVSGNKNSRNFTLSTVTTGASKLYAVKLKVSNESMKPGKYTLQLYAYPEGDSTAAKPVKVNVKVTVK